MEENGLKFFVIDNYYLQEEMRSKLLGIITHHADVIRLHNEMQTFFTNRAGILILGTVLAGTANVILVGTNKIGPVFMFVISLNHFRTLMDCRYGQIYQNNFESIHEATCKMPWYLWNTNNKNMYLMILMQTTKLRPLTLASLVTINNDLLIYCLRFIYGTGNIFYTIMNKRNHLS